MKQFEKERETAEGLAQKCVTVGGMSLEYRFLYRRSSAVRFSIRVDNGEETEEAGLCNDLCAAVERYRALIRGFVTPCTLRDIAEDMREPRKFRKTPLQKRNLMVK